LGASPPLNAIDTTACMGAGIGQAIGMEKAGVKEKIVAVIGDSTFLHSGIAPLINAVYDDSHITVIILDNRTTAMTGHQDHPGTGVSAQGRQTKAVVIEDLVRGLGVSNIRVVDAFNIKDIREAVKTSLDSGELSVVVVRGDCVVHPPRHAAPPSVDVDKCNQCGTCLLIGCAAIQQDDEGRSYIEASLCTGCGICRQICPRQAIGRTNEVKG
jgi:indolepyruvate ferredoxin oxidoreductase alpha subunit